MDHQVTIAYSWSSSGDSMDWLLIVISNRVADGFSLFGFNQFHSFILCITNGRSFFPQRWEHLTMPVMTENEAQCGFNQEMEKVDLKF